MNRNILIHLVTFFALFFNHGFSQAIKLESPDRNITATIVPGSNAHSLIDYNLANSAGNIIKNGTIGLDVANIRDSNYSCGKPQRKSASTSWKPVYGERKIIPENYNQVNLTFTSKRDSSLKLVVTCRAYNEGFAFRYRVIQENTILTLKNELSQFPFVETARAWVSSTAQGVITEKSISEVKELVERPLTIKLGNNLFISLGEAGLVDFARMKFSSNGNNSFSSQLYGEVKAADSLVSPWRYVLVGKSPANLLQKNYLVLNLNEPNKIENTGWIKPGKVIREVTLTTNGGYNTIDFAASHHIQYICFDAGWYGKEDHDTSDATRVRLDPARSKGPLDLKKVIEYGKQKKVGVLLYVNRRALERQLDTLLPLYQSWGIKGIKFGFVQVGSQTWTSWLHTAISKAAKYQMLVDVHDEYRPTGYSRTYPNLLTQEGIRGDEESPGIKHTITTLFTRMLAGAADNTNCYFTGRVSKMGSHVAQLAKAVCIYSPFQFLYWYDRPVADSSRKGNEGEIIEVPELSWYNALPTVWDDTRVLEGSMQSFATIARKKDNSWFIGSLNGDTARTANWSCTFLDKNRKYKAVIYRDDPAINTPTKVSISTIDVNNRTVLKIPVAARNGIAVRIYPY